MRIGFLDSGIGGLNVLRETIRELPGEDYVYLADTANAPYGTKSGDEVRALVLRIVDGLVADYGIDMLVVACNTATAVAVETLRAAHDFPVVGLEPAVRPAVQLCRDGGKRVLVLATELTLKEKKFIDLVAHEDSDGIVDSLAMPGLVELADALEYSGRKAESYIREKFEGMDLSAYGTVVLGCTHFIYFRPLLEKILPSGIDIIDGTKGTVKRIRNLAAKLPPRPDAPSSGTVILISSDPAKISPDTLKKLFEGDM